MHAAIRRYVMTCAALGGVLLLEFSPGMASAEDAAKPTALLVGGSGQYGTLTDEEMATALHGYFADYTRVNVPFPGDPQNFSDSVAVGTNTLCTAVYATAGPKTIGGVSEGAPVVYEVLRRLATDPNPPPRGELNAIVYGAPSPVYYLFGPPYQPLPETQYNLIVVTVEYDGIADFPDNGFNMLAVTNALMGADQLHVAAAYTTDLSKVPAPDITVITNAKGGTTTSYLVPTPLLPLLKPLVDLGVDPSTIAGLDAVLRPIIDSAYFRTPPVQVTAPTSTSAPNTPPNLAATTLTVNTAPVVTSGSTTADQGILAKAGSSDTATQVRRGLDTSVAGAAPVTNVFAQAGSNASPRGQHGFQTAISAITNPGTGLPNGRNGKLGRVDANRAPTGNAVKPAKSAGDQVGSTLSKTGTKKLSKSGT